MDAAKKTRLEAAGWRSGNAEDFLELTQEEVALVEIKLVLSDYMRELRQQNHWTQTQVAQRIGSSQSRVAKMESADASVSLDLIIKSLFSLGATVKDVGCTIARPA